METQTILLLWSHMTIVTGRNYARAGRAAGGRHIQPPNILGSGRGSCKTATRESEYLRRNAVVGVRAYSLPRSTRTLRKQEFKP